MDPIFSSPFQAILFFICCSCLVVVFALFALLFLVRRNLSVSFWYSSRRGDAIDAEYTVTDEEIIDAEYRPSPRVNRLEDPDRKFPHDP